MTMRGADGDGDGDGDGGSDKIRKYTFAVVVKNVDNPFFTVVKDGCEDRARHLTALLKKESEKKSREERSPDDDAAEGAGGAGAEAGASSVSSAVESAFDGGVESVECLYVGSADGTDADAQAAIVDDLIRGRYTHGGTSVNVTVHGIALAAIDADVAGGALARAERAGIPTVTFDSDASPRETFGRRAYIGTDNVAFGEELGKLLVQLSPGGGTYGLLAASAPNVQLRVDGVRRRLAGSGWTELGGGRSPFDCLDDVETAVDGMYDLAAAPGAPSGGRGAAAAAAAASASSARSSSRGDAGVGVDAIIPVGGWPMYNVTGWKEFVDGHRHLTLVVGDSLDVQVGLMNRAYVHGLVGQIPYQMGEYAMDTLLKIRRNETIDDVITGTSLLEILRFPLLLPKLEVSENHIGSLAIMGYVFFALIALMAAGFAGWTFFYQKRKERIVTASQPFFLYMICAGVLVFSSSLIPLSIDDANYSPRTVDRACMATPWLFFLGFTTAFSALFSKLRRLNIIFRSAKKMKKVTITPRDVLRPYAALLAANVFVLACWTVLDPLTYQRDPHEGTDAWNRVISTYGHCTSDGWAPYLGSLAGINFAVLVLANVQAYQARNIHTEFSESHHIASLMAGGLQVSMVAAPLLFIVSDQPPALFLLMSLLIFVVSVSTMGLMFVPKMLYLRQTRKAKREKLKKRERTTEADGGNHRSDTGRLETGEGEEGGLVGTGGRRYASDGEMGQTNSLERSSYIDSSYADEEDDEIDDDEGGAYVLATRVDSSLIAWKSMRKRRRAEERFLAKRQNQQHPASQRPRHHIYADGQRRMGDGDGGLQKQLSLPSRLLPTQLPSESAVEDEEDGGGDRERGDDGDGDSDGKHDNRGLEEKKEDEKKKKDKSDGGVDERVEDGDERRIGMQRTYQSQMLVSYTDLDFDPSGLFSGSNNPTSCGQGRNFDSGLGSIPEKSMNDLESSQSDLVDRNREARGVDEEEGEGSLENLFGLEEEDKTLEKPAIVAAATASCASQWEEDAGEGSLEDL